MAANDPIILKRNAGDTGFEEVLGASAVRDALSAQPLATVLTNTTASFTTAQESKLASIATGATANSPDATLLARANHTGTQAVSTISPVSSSSLIGRHAGGSGAAQEVSVGNGLEFSGSGIRRQALTGDVTASAGSNATAIALDVVTNAKLANVATATVKGRLSAGTGDPEDVTLDALKTAVGADAATATTAGTVPGIGGTAAGNALLLSQWLFSQAAYLCSAFTSYGATGTATGAGSLDAGFTATTGTTAGSAIRRGPSSFARAVRRGGGNPSAPNLHFWTLAGGQAMLLRGLSGGTANGISLVFLGDKTWNTTTVGAPTNGVGWRVRGNNLHAVVWKAGAEVESASLLTLNNSQNYAVASLWDGAGNVVFYLEGAVVFTTAEGPVTTNGYAVTEYSVENNADAAAQVLGVHNWRIW
jgi:hypothetical protein